MIARLRGILDSVDGSGAIIDVSGVGYQVFASAKSLDRFGRVGDPVVVTVETHVREDHIHLYGFATDEERDWFRLLTNVQGVGAKVALAILSVLQPDALLTAIAAQDKAAVAQANGVGPKLAQRIVVELKDKAGQLMIGAAPIAPIGTKPLEPHGHNAADTLMQDAVSALTNLGFSPSDALVAVSAARQDQGETADLNMLVKAGLKALSP